MLLPRLFFWWSRLRGARAFHPRGTTFLARWLPADDMASIARSPLGVPGQAVVRISHGVGLPPSFPDVVGVAIKVLDAHGPNQDQDLLLASTGSGRIGRRMFVPTRHVARIPLSTILPYEMDGERGPVYARSVPGWVRSTYADVARQGASAVPDLELRLHGPRGPLLAHVVTIDTLPAEVGEQIRYDPTNTGDPLRAAGILNAIRGPTYAASQDGRRAPRTPAVTKAASRPDQGSPAGRIAHGTQDG